MSNMEGPGGFERGEGAQSGGMFDAVMTGETDEFRGRQQLPPPHPRAGVPSVASETYNPVGQQSPQTARVALPGFTTTGTQIEKLRRRGAAEEEARALHPEVVQHELARYIREFREADPKNKLFIPQNVERATIVTGLHFTALLSHVRKELGDGAAFGADGGFVAPGFEFHYSVPFNGGPVDYSGSAWQWERMGYYERIHNRRKRDTSLLAVVRMVDIGDSRGPLNDPDDPDDDAQISSGLMFTPSEAFGFELTQDSGQTMLGKVVFEDRDQLKYFLQHQIYEPFKRLYQFPSQETTPGGAMTRGTAVRKAAAQTLVASSRGFIRGLRGQRITDEQQ